MVIRTIELLLEYIGIILCIYRIEKQKPKLDWQIVGILGLDWVIMFGQMLEDVRKWNKLLIYILLLLYMKAHFKNTWAKTLQRYGVMFVTIPTLQIIFYYGIKILFPSMLLTDYKGIVINAFSCLVLFMYKEEKIKRVITKITVRKEFIIIVLYALPIICMLYLYNQNGLVEYTLSIQFLAEIVSLSLVSVLWFSAEIQHKHEMKELQMYQLYNQAFEESIATIRKRQHEFDNHINALCCMKYTITDKDELIKEQEEYCKSILKDSDINKLLKLQSSPILIGFLYSKIEMAKEKGIVTKYDIQEVKIENGIEIYEFIELIGILFDNAVEALIFEEEKQIIFNLSREESTFTVEVANHSRIFMNSELEKFCLYGYSTKGKQRGSGLARVKEIVKKYSAIFVVENKIYEGENFLSFHITFMAKNK